MNREATVGQTIPSVQAARLDRVTATEHSSAVFPCVHLGFHLLRPGPDGLKQ
jgi:hypothetical protein